MDAICASAILLALIGLVATAVVRIAGERRLVLQKNIAEQVVMNVAEDLRSSDPSNALRKIPKWATPHLPHGKLAVRAVEIESRTSATLPVALSSYQIELSWANRPAAPRESYQLIVWK